MFNIETLRSKSDADLTKITSDLGVKIAKNSNENDKIFAILDFQASNTKVAKDYFNATETAVNPTENTQPAPKKASAKKRQPKRKLKLRAMKLLLKPKNRKVLKPKKRPKKQQKNPRIL